MRRILLTAAFGFVIASQTFAADWPRFRGPNGTGIVDDPGVPAKWGLNDVLDKVEIPGRGNSSPIISKGKLFLQSASDDGSERMMLCYDARTLKHLWTAKVPGGVGKTHSKNTLASSTPAADGERVVGLFWDGRDISLHAFDYAGKDLWHTPIGSFTSQHGVGLEHAGTAVREAADCASPTGSSEPRDESFVRKQRHGMATVN